MTVIVRDRLQSAIDGRKSLREVVQSRPTLEYDGVFGGEGGTWTSAAFVEAAFKSLGGK
jgi:hypothetical protein